MTSDKKICVAHIHRGFFKKSETFIYYPATGMRHVHPIFIAREFFNLELFPIPAADRLAIARRAWTWRWLWQGIGHRMLGRELLAEHFIRQHNAMLMHAHFGQNGIWALRLKRKLHLPLVTTFYGKDLSSAGYLAVCREGYPWLFKEGDLFLVEGPHMKDRLAALGCPEEKIAIQRIAIAVNDLAFRMRRPKKKGDNVVILFSGRFVEKKGLLLALSALHNLRSTFPLFEFRIIGDGPLRPEIEHFIQARHMGTYVHLLGFLNYSDHLEQMKCADLFLHPSITARDGDSEGGAPTTILEAQALGLPVLSTFHADIPHVVVPGESALLSAEGDVTGLAENTARLLMNQQSWAAMGQVGRSHIETYHNAIRENPRLEMHYRGLIETTGSQRKR